MNATRFVSPRDVNRVVSDWLRLPLDKMLSNNKEHRLALGRQVGMYLVREVFGMSYTAIGEVYGRDHSTVIVNTARLRRRMAQEPNFANQIERLRDGMTPAQGPWRADRWRTRRLTRIQEHLWALIDDVKYEQDCRTCQHQHSFRHSR